ncbi:MAG: DUF5361 domain-containing protein [Actinomyces sp.]|nr:DUF5361 domain-containing protein [Actinomyces sp.]
MRFFGVSDWRTLPPSLAADWCAALVTQPESWTHRKLNPDWRWSLDSQLGAAAVDQLRILAWQQTKDGAKGRKQPKPTPRPGVAGYRPGGKKTVTINTAEIDRQLSRPRKDLGRVR